MVGQEEVVKSIIQSSTANPIRNALFHGQLSIELQRGSKLRQRFFREHAGVPSQFPLQMFHDVIAFRFSRFNLRASDFDVYGAGVGKANQFAGMLFENAYCKPGCILGFDARCKGCLPGSEFCMLSFRTQGPRDLAVDNDLNAIHGPATGDAAFNLK